MKNGAVGHLYLDELPSQAELSRMLRSRRRHQRVDTVVPGERDLSVSRRAALRAIRLYQRHVSHRLDRCCMFEPSCSRYAELAIAHQGVLAGSLATWRRLRRCVPRNEGEIDYPKGVSRCRTK